MDYSEKLVVNGLKAGDTEAYQYIYDTHYQVLCHTANRYVRDSFVAETIVGDMIYRMWEHRDTLNVNTSLRSYLLQAVRNGCIDYLRSKHQRYEVAASQLAEGDRIDELADGEQPYEQLVGNELADRVDMAIEHLPAECRRVFELSRFMGKRHAEIASELNISVSTVKYHLRNALQLLTKELGSYIVFVFFVCGMTV